MNDFSVVIPTLNGGARWKLLVNSLEKQSYPPKRVIVLDSGSKDETLEVAAKSGFQIYKLDGSRFDHGGTRQIGIELCHESLIIFMTQDAVLYDEKSLENLVSAFRDPKVAVAYGRQIPHLDATPIAAHARIYNYPERSEIRSIESAAKRGIKAAFTSNSFCCYRKNALNQIGGFPKRIILGEDAYVAAKLLMSGWKIAYVAEAQVFHSHNYTIWQEFQRYFDIGVFHSRERWILERFGRAEGEGLKYIFSEFSYLLKRAPQQIPSALVRNICKYTAYRLGLIEARLPKWLKLKLSMNKLYFQKDAG